MLSQITEQVFTPRAKLQGRLSYLEVLNENIELVQLLVQRLPFRRELLDALQYHSYTRQNPNQAQRLHVFAEEKAATRC